MRNFDNNDKPRTGASDRFHREDSSRPARSNNDNAMQFRKDKRSHKSTSRVERVSDKPRSGGGSDYASKGSGQRRSFNPNFSADNKFIGTPSEKRSDYSSSRGKDSERSSFKSRGGDDWKSKGDFKPRGEWKPREDRGEGGYKKYGDKPSEGRKSYGDRSFDGKKSFDKGSSSYGKKSYGDKPYGDKSFGGKSYADKKNQYGNAKGRYDSSNYPRFAAPISEKAIRLNRYLAISGICSRREADDLIAAGVVTVNGEVVTELGSKVFSSDEVKFNDSLVKGEKKVYIVMNKPKGFVTTIEDPHADRTVIDLVKNLCTERVYPVGRLDKNSLGVLLITNDGDLTRSLTHPSYEKKKIYQVSLDKSLTRADMDQIAQGVVLEDGPISADAISYVGDSKKEIGVEIHSGRNRIIRRIFESLGYKVQKLDRVYFAGLTKKNLKRGEWRFLAPKEVSMLKSVEYE